MKSNLSATHLQFVVCVCVCVCEHAHVYAFVRIKYSLAFVLIVYVGRINPLLPRACFMYHQLKLKKFCILPTQCIYVFYVHLRINSDYLPIHRSLIGWYNRDGMCLLRVTNFILKFLLRLFWQTASCNKMLRCGHLTGGQ